MNDLDKMARELLAAEFERRGLRSVAAAAVNGSYDSDPEHAAIRAALQTAPPGYVLVDRATLLEMRDVAMRWTREGRLPECGAFSRIAQDADAMLAAATEVKR